MTSTAPSAPPSSLAIAVVSSSTISVQWGSVPCIHQNGDITGYSVMGSGNTQTMPVSGAGTTQTTISGFIPSTTYSIEVAAVNSAGTGVYSDLVMNETLSSKRLISVYLHLMKTTCPLSLDWAGSQQTICIHVNFTGVYLMLNEKFIPNHGYVDISNIGSTDDTALLCHTNRPPPAGSSHSGGDWYAPDGDRVDGDDVSGVTRNRGPMVVRLKRTTGTPAEGIYRCEVNDNTETNKTVYVGLYSDGGN